MSTVNQFDSVDAAPAACQQQDPTLCPRPPDLAYRCRNDDRRTLEFVGVGVEPLTGFPAADFIAGRRQWAQLIKPEDFDRAGEMARQTAAGQLYQFEYCIRHRDGAERWVLDQGRGVFDEAQALIAFEGFVTDLTGRRPADKEGAATAPGRATPGGDVGDCEQMALLTVAYLGDTQGRLTCFNEQAVGQRPQPGDADQRVCAALRATDQRLRWALQAGGGGAWDWDLKGGEAWWSPEMYALWGAAPGTPMGLENSLALVVEPDREHLRAAVETAIARRTDYQYEFRICHPTRGERWMASQGRLIFDPNGEPVCLSGFSFDITERKRAAAALSDSEERLRHALDAAAMMTFDWDIQRDAVEQSASAAPAFGGLQDWTAGALAQVCELVHPDDRKRFVANVEAALEHADGRYANEFRIVQPDGRIAWVTESGLVEHDAQGRPTRLIGLSQDVTARRQVEEALRRRERELQQAEERARLALEAGHMATWDLQLPDGPMVWNEAHYRMLGYRVGEVAPGYAAWVERLHPDDLPTMTAAFERSLAQRGDYVGEYRVIWPDGTQHWLESRGRTECDAAGRPSRSYGVMLDLTARKVIEEKLRRSNERLRLLLDALPVAVTIADDPQCRVITSNPVASALFEAGRDANVSASAQAPLCHRYFHQGRELRPDELPMQLAVLGNRDITDMEVDARLSSGREWTALVSSRPLHGPDGEVIGGISILHDITERKAARREQEKLLRLIEASGDFIATADLDGRITYMNAGARRMVGVSAAAPLGTLRLADLVPASSQLFFRDTVMRCIDEQGHWEGATQLRNLETGALVDVERHMVLLRDPHTGEPWCYASVTRDITAQKRAAELLRLSEEKLRLAQRVAEIGTFDVDLQAGINTWTPELEAIYGLSPGGFAGTQAAWEALIHPEDRATVVGLVKQSFQTEMPTVGEWRVRRPDGSVHWVVGRWQTFRDAAGQPARMIGVNFDITARKEAEETLRKASRRKEAFIAILAHELRNPLAPIRNAVEILKLTGSLDPTQQAARDMIDRQVRHLVRLVDDLQDVSRINQGRLQLRRERIALAAILDQVLESARPQFEQAGQRLTATLPEVPIMLDADPVRLVQVFANLLDNACKYSERGGATCLSVARTATQVVVRVADQGIGIAPEDLPRLFELFVQAGTPAGQMPAGLGIGLALSRGLVELHGGTIEARSPGPGQGSEFSVFLPALPAAPALAADPPAPPPSGPAAPVRVLVVDDNVDSAESLAFLLGASGYAVTTAYDGLAAVAAAACERPQIVLLDLGMPKLDGYSACRRIREQPWGRAMRIIALTGWGQADDRRRIQEAGFDLHLVKPIELSVLLGLLAETPAGLGG